MDYVQPSLERINHAHYAIVSVLIDDYEFQIRVVLKDNRVQKALQLKGAAECRNDQRKLHGALNRRMAVER
jgi:hypothetical protein